MTAFTAKSKLTTAFKNVLRCKIVLSQHVPPSFCLHSFCHQLEFIHALRAFHACVTSKCSWNWELAKLKQYAVMLQCLLHTKFEMQAIHNGASELKLQLGKIACHSCTHENACYPLPTGAKVCPSFPSNWNCKGNRRGFFANIL